MNLANLFKFIVPIAAGVFMPAIVPTLGAAAAGTGAAGAGAAGAAGAGAAGALLSEFGNAAARAAASSAVGMAQNAILPQKKQPPRPTTQPYLW